MNKSLRAFHGQQKIKAKYTARVLAHKLADEIVQGVGYDNDDGQVRACSVGCTLDRYDHRGYESELGIPAVLAHIQDAIHEGLNFEDAVEFPGQFLDAIEVGADLRFVFSRFTIWFLTDEKFGIKQYLKAQENLDLLDKLVDFHQRVIAGEDPREAWARAAWARAAWASETWAREALARAAWASETWAREALASEAWASEALASAAWARAAWASEAWARAALARAALASETWAREALASEAWASEALAHAAAKKEYWIAARDQLLKLLSEAPVIETVNE